MFLAVVIRPSLRPRCRRSRPRPGRSNARHGSSCHIWSLDDRGADLWPAGDLFGRRHLMFVALGIFIVASVLCAASPTIEWLTLARVLQGLGGGGLMTLSQALVGEAVPPRERARYQGYLAAVAVSADTFGPVAGGFLTEHFGWQSIFLVNVPIGLGALVLAWRLPTVSVAAQRRRAESGGLVLFTLVRGDDAAGAGAFQHADSHALPIGAALFAAGLIALGALGATGKPRGVAAHSVGAFAAVGDLAQRRLGGVPRRGAGVAHYILAGVSRSGARRVAVGNRPAAGAAHHRNWHRLAGDRQAGEQDRLDHGFSGGRACVGDAQSCRAGVLGVRARHQRADRGAADARPVFRNGDGRRAGHRAERGGAGPAGEAAASVQFSRSIGAAFGTALVSTVLFAVLVTLQSGGGAGFRGDGRAGGKRRASAAARSAGRHSGRHRGGVSRGIPADGGLYAGRVFPRADQSDAADLTLKTAFRHL